MSTRSQLRLLSLAFAVSWTAMTLWYSAPLDTAKIVVWVIAGGIAGLLWYWLYASWYRWYFDRWD